MSKSGYAPGGGKNTMGPGAGMAPPPFSLTAARAAGGHGRVDPALFAQMMARQRMGPQGGMGGGQQMMHWGAPGQQGGGGMQSGLAQYAMQQQMQKAAQQAAMLRAQQPPPVAPPPQQQQPGQPQDYHMSF